MADRIRMSLGAPMVNIEIHDNQIFDNIGIACEMFTKYAGFTEEFLVFDVSKYEKGKGIRMDALFSITPHLTSRYDNVQWRYNRTGTTQFTTVTGNSGLSAVLDTFSISDELSDPIEYSVKMTDENFDRATKRGLVVVEFWASWNEANKVTILDGLHHDVDSSVLAFEIASRMCFRDACTKAQLKLLEPIMKVEVVTPEDFMGDVIGDLNSRRGQINTQEQRGNATVITAMVPLANMFGYINNLRSMSQGRAQYSMFFDHYDKVPQNVQEEVTKKTGYING